MVGDASAIQVTARVEIGLEDVAAAVRARDALAPESTGFLALRTEGNRLVLEVPAGNTKRVLATIDDAFSCLQAALGAEMDLDAE